MKKFEEDRRIQAESGWIVQSSQIIAAAAGRINKVIVTYRK